MDRAISTLPVFFSPFKKKKKEILVVVFWNYINRLKRKNNTKTRCIVLIRFWQKALHGLE